MSEFAAKLSGQTAPLVTSTEAGIDDGWTMGRPYADSNWEQNVRRFGRLYGAESDDEVIIPAQSPEAPTDIKSRVAAAAIWAAMEVSIIHTRLRVLV